MANPTTGQSGLKLSGVPSTLKVPPNYSVSPEPGKIQSLLEYNEHDIYHKFSPHTNNTGLLRFGKEQPYVYRYIDEKNKSFIPPIPANSIFDKIWPLTSITAGSDDLYRVSSFITSGKGVLFLGKQLLLQTQAKFDETNLYNPAEVPLAAARPLSQGLLPRPKRHIDTSGGILGALASIIGISISNGDTAPPSTVGQDALPTFAKSGGKGLLRATTANKAISIARLKWPEAGPNLPTNNNFLKGLIHDATSTIKSFLSPFIPVRQAGVKYRADEHLFDRMRGDGAGQLSYNNKDGVRVTIDQIRRENSMVLSNNRVYKSLILQSPRSQYGTDYKYLDEYNGNLTTGVDLIIGNVQKNYRMARAGLGDGLNQIGVLSGNGSYVSAVPITSPISYTGWREWNPYKDDLIAFFFYDIVNDKFIPFRATVKGVSDTTTANWEELRFIGRADQIYTYNGFVRSLAFQFNVVISSLADLLPTWQKINYMKTSLKPAGYTTKKTLSGEDQKNVIYNRFMIPPMFTLTIGDMYKYQPIVINNFTVNIPENANWETLNENNSEYWNYLHNSIEAADRSTRYAQLPKEAEISITCNLLEKERAIVGGVDFGHFPRDENWDPVGEDFDKPYMPMSSKFDWDMLIGDQKNDSKINTRKSNSPSGISPGGTLQQREEVTSNNL